MADFCKQCSTDHFGEDYKDLADLADKEAEGLYPIVLCEGCGAIQVNNAGECISDDCLRAGHCTVTPEKPEPASKDDVKF